MKHILLFLGALLICCASSQAQITITSSDMPVSGDTLRYSSAAALGSGIILGDSGASMTWNYSTLTPRTQAVDTYKSALAVSFTYALISFNAYGYKVADSFPGGAFLPVAITQLYTFFEKQTSPSRFAAVALGVKIAGLPTPFNNTKDDIWYYFPLAYNNNDSSDYALTIGLTSTAYIKQTGYRKTRVDGWGTIVTPYYTTPTNCIRVRSEIHGVDTIKFGSIPIGIPQNTVEYKWLVNGGHYPALSVVTNVTGATETISSIRYRDGKRDFTTATPTVATAIMEVKAFPNPAVNGQVTLGLPQSWKQYQVEIFDMQSKLVYSVANECNLDLKQLPKGQYIGRVTTGGSKGFVQITLE